jgi:hypothetical protein
MIFAGCLLPHTNQANINPPGLNKSSTKSFKTKKNFHVGFEKSYFISTQ